MNDRNEARWCRNGGCLFKAFLCAAIVWPLAPGSAVGGAVSAAKPARRTESIAGRLQVSRAQARTMRVLPGRARGGLRAELSGTDGEEALELAPVSVRAPGFQVSTVDGRGRLRRVPVPATGIFRGRIDGQPDSEVAATYRRGGLRALMRTGQGRWSGIQPDPSGGHVRYDVADLEPVAASCGVVLDQSSALVTAMASQGEEPVTAEASQLYVVEIAFDADHEFYVANGEDVAATVADIEGIVNALNVIYERDVGVTYLVTEILVRDTPDDPYDTADPNGLLGAFRGHWAMNHGDVERDICHLMTGRDLTGSTIGIAYMAGICSGFSGYGLSQSTGWTSNFARRVALTAHELGHNWNASHCSCNIMCSSLGGCTGDLSGFSAPSIQTITAYRDTRSCLSLQEVGDPPQAEDDYVWTPVGEAVEIDVLANDSDANGDPLILDSVTSPLHGSIEVLAGEVVRYQPDPGYIGADEFAYETVDGGDGSAVGTVFVHVYDPETPDHHWAMDEGIGTEVEDAAGGTDGALMNGDSESWVVGASGAALCFDGIDDYVSMGAGVQAGLHGTSTLAFWIRTTQAGHDNPGLAPGVAGTTSSLDGLQWGWIDADGHIGLRMGDGDGIRSGGVVNDGIWHHVVMVREQWSGRLALYLDGEPQAEAEDAPGVAAAGFTSLGRIENTDGTTRYLAGELDDVCVFARALAPAEVEVLFRETATANADGDGMPDPDDPDDDNDRVSDLAELVAGTNPLDPMSRLNLEIAETGSGPRAVAFDSVTGRRYQLEVCADLNANEWTVFGDPVPGTGGLLVIDGPADGGPWWYRLAVERVP